MDNKIVRAAARAALALLAAALICILSACTPEVPDNITTEAPATSSAPRELEVVSGGKAIYRVVYREGGTAAELEAARAVAKTLGRICSAEVTLASDMLMPGQEYPAEGYDILVGYTGYPESRRAYEELSYGSYSVSADGGRIVLAARGDNEISRTTDEFLSLLTVTGKGDECRVVFPSDAVRRGTLSDEAAALPMISGGEYDSVYSTGNGAYMVVVKKADTDISTAYLAALAEAGFEERIRHTDEKNVFCSFEGKGLTVYTAFCDKTLRVIVQKGSLSDIMFPDRAPAAGSTEPLVSFVGLAYDTKNNGSLYKNGLSLIWRLSDGSFMIADGGGQNATHAKLVYDELCRLAPDKNNIRISAWFITHAHIDHAGVFHMFTQSYRDRVKLDRLICNIPTNAYLQGLTDDSTESSAVAMSDTIHSDIKKWQGLEVIKAHPGHKYYIAGAEIAVYTTADMLYPALEATTANSTSVVFGVTVDGKKLLVTGDAGADACGVAVAVWGRALKSDAMTVIHHGLRGATTQFYSFVNPETVLWPSALVLFEDTRSRSYNAYLLNSLAVKYSYVADNKIYTFAAKDLTKPVEKR